MVHPMIRIRGSLLLSAVLLLVGCASQPKTAEQLRENVNRKAAFSGREVFEVKKPYAEVAGTLRKKWLECFGTTTTGDVRHGQGLKGTIIYIHKPTVTVTAQRTELALQRKTEGRGMKELGSPPPDGFFIAVTDVYPLDKKTTRVDVQRHTPGFDAGMKAIRHWAEGTNLGCPDLSQ